MNDMQRGPTVKTGPETVSPATETMVADEKLLAGLRNGAWLHAQQFPPLRYAVPGLIPEGFTLFVGAPKIGKSWAVLDFGMANATGGITLGGVQVDQRAVFYLALEDGDRRLQERCWTLLHGQPIPAGVEYMTLVEGSILDTIAAWLRRHRGEPALVVLDTLGKVMPPALPGESSYGRDYRIGSWLKGLCNEHPRLALVVNHHDRKATADDFVDSVSATHGLAGAADTIVVVTRDRNETAGLLQVTGRDVPEGEYALTFTKGVWRLDGATLEQAAQNGQRVKATTRATGAVGERMLDLVTFAYQNPGGIRRGDVAKVLGIDAAVAGKYLARAVEAGRLQRAERGLYTPVTYVTSDTSDNVTRDVRDTYPGEQGAFPDDEQEDIARAG